MLYYILLFLTGLLGLIAVGKVTRILELSAEINDKKSKVNWNRINGIAMFIYMLLFLGLCIGEMFVHGSRLLGESGSEHGVLTDRLFMVTFWVTVVVFVFTHILLFYFSYRYRGQKDRKAYFYPVNDRLEVIWTIVPAVFMAALIIWGLDTWNNITNANPEDAEVIQVYGYQFGWLARYAGPDGELGPSNYNFVSSKNGVGLVTKEDRKAKMEELDGQMAQLRGTMEKMGATIEEYKATGARTYDALIDSLEEELDALEETLENRELHMARLKDFDPALLADSFVHAGYDDVYNNVLYLPVNRPVTLEFGARDVIHSAYIPHLRTQMNCVPGMATYFTLTPRLTTEQMREKLGDPEFEYFMACAKICGAAHFNMKMTVKVVEEEEYRKWLDAQTPYYVAEYKQSEQELQEDNQAEEETPETEMAGDEVEEATEADEAVASL